MIICLFDSKYVVPKEILPTELTENQQLYLKVQQLGERVLSGITKLQILHQDNAPCHCVFSVAQFFTFSVAPAPVLATFSVLLIFFFHKDK